MRGCWPHRLRSGPTPDRRDAGPANHRAFRGAVQGDRSRLRGLGLLEKAEGLTFNNLSEPGRSTGGSASEGWQSGRLHRS